MKEENVFKETGQKIDQALELDIDHANDITEEHLLEAITNRVVHLLERNPELLFSYLYRLDVLEHKIQHALNHQTTIPPYEALARLILNRQKERIITKKKYKQEPLKGWGLD